VTIVPFLISSLLMEFLLADDESRVPSREREMLT